MRGYNSSSTNCVARRRGLAGQETRGESAVKSDVQGPARRAKGQKAFANTSPVAGVLLASILVVAYYTWFPTRNLSYQESQISLLFLGLGTGAALALSREVAVRPYSLMAMNWSFILLFVGVAGWQQYVSGSFLYPGLSSDFGVRTALMCAVVWCVSMGGGALLGRSRGAQRPGRHLPLPPEVRLDPRFLRVATFACLTSSAFLLAQGGLAILSSRSAAWTALDTGSIATTQLITTSLRNLPLYCLALSVLIYKRWGVGRSHLAVQALCCLVTNSPTSTPRFQVATVLFGLAVLVFPRIWRGARFMLFFLTSFVVVFPILSMFRRDSFIQDLGGAGPTSMLSGIGQFSSGDYDAFSMILYALQFVEDHGSTYGRQLVGASLFFVPRSIWPDKPVGTGAMILSTYGYDFTNASASLIAEGLVNFGFFGLVFFGAAMGMVSAFLDKRYWTLRMIDAIDFRFLGVLYPFMLPLFFFLNRGDLLSGLGYLASHIASLAAMWLLALYVSKDRDTQIESVVRRRPRFTSPSSSKRLL